MRYPCPYKVHGPPLPAKGKGPGALYCGHCQRAIDLDRRIHGHTVNKPAGTKP